MLENECFPSELGMKRGIKNKSAIRSGTVITIRFVARVRGSWFADEHIFKVRVCCCRAGNLCDLCRWWSRGCESRAACATHACAFGERVSSGCARVRCCRRAYLDRTMASMLPANRDESSDTPIWTVSPPRTSNGLPCLRHPGRSLPS